MVIHCQFSCARDVNNKDPVKMMPLELVDQKEKQFSIEKKVSYFVLAVILFHILKIFQIYMDHRLATARQPIVCLSTFANESTAKQET